MNLEFTGPQVYLGSHDQTGRGCVRGQSPVPRSRGLLCPSTSVRAQVPVSRRGNSLFAVLQKDHPNGKRVTTIFTTHTIPLTESWFHSELRRTETRLSWTLSVPSCVLSGTKPRGPCAPVHVRRPQEPSATTPRDFQDL